MIEYNVIITSTLQNSAKIDNFFDIVSLEIKKEECFAEYTPLFRIIINTYLIFHYTYFHNNSDNHQK